MIGVSSSSRSFAALGRYLVVGRDNVEEGRVAWTSARNLPTDDPELAAKIMRATASQNVRVAQPVYHLALSFDPRDVVDRVAMERVADRVLEELKLTEHQAVIVAHADRAHPHMHILVNRVHPETGCVWDRWQDQPVVQRVLREEEKRLGLRVVQSSLDTNRERQEISQRQRTDVTPGAQPDLTATEPRSSPKMAALQAEFDAHDRANELASGRYSAERDVAAAEARVLQVETALVRAERARVAFETALAKVYRNPDAAKAAFLDAAEQGDRSEATRRMRETPEAFGELAAGPERRGLLGRAREDDGAARAAAKEAAGYGAELAIARAELARAVGPAIGKGSDATSVTKSATQAVAIDLDGARRRLEAARTAQSSAPAAEQIEFRLRQALRRLSPKEVEQLRWTLSPRRLTLAHKLRQTVRDVALGRDDA